MEQQYKIPGFSDFMTQMETYQKEAMEQMSKTMGEIFGEKNPMNIFNAEKLNENPVMGSVSDFLDIMQNTTKGMIELSEIMMPGLSKNGTNPMSSFFENLHELPGEIMKKVLEIPPVGITRPYQEKINKALDKLAVFNTAAMEFMYCTLVPFEEATRMTLKEIVKQSESVASLEDAQKVYEKWLKIMEAEYQSLFKTDRYKHVLARIISAMAEYRAASRELILDLIHLSGLPFGREVDELCKDVFELKKKIKILENQIKKMEKETA